MSEEAKSRKGHRSQATKLCGSITNELNESNPNLEIIERCLYELIRQRDILLQLDAEVVKNCSNVEKEVEEASERMMNVNFTIMKAQRLFENQNNVEYRQNNMHTRNVKLPQLKLAKFEGNPLNWINFWELFKSSVHERQDLPAPAKFQYLLGQLEGEAARLVAGFSHSATDYAEAIDLLLKTYGQEHILTQSRLNAILDLPSPKPTSESLSNFRSSFEGHLRVLKSSGSDIEHSGYVFAHILLRKLDKQTKDNLNRANGSKIWSLENFRECINNEIQHLTSLNDVEYSSQNGTTDDSLYTSSFNVSNSNYSKSNYNCRLCKGDHFALNCTQFPTPQSRIEQVKRCNLCYNCLYSNHRLSSCINKGRCKLCNKRHHTALCTSASGPKPLKQYPSTSDGRNKTMLYETHNQPIRESSDSDTNNAYSSLNLPVAVTSLLSNNATDQVSLLPTANVTIIQNNYKQSYKALLDTGSMSTFVIRDVVSSLKIPISKRITLEVDGFDSKGTRKIYDVVELDVCTDEGITRIKAIVVDNLANRITMVGRGKVINEVNKYKLNLADNACYDRINCLHLLIGVDNLYKFLHGNRVRDNIYEIPSKLGTVILGTFETPVEVSTSCNVTTMLHIGTQNSDDSIANLWKLDAIGIGDNSSDDYDALEKFKSNLSYKDGKYSTGLPWKDDTIKLPTNKAMAFQRMKSVWKNLSRDEDKLAMYNDIIKDQLNREFIEIVDNDYAIDSTTTKIHYLPHHHVAKDSDTTPIRIVFDCSAKTGNSYSLNDCLLTGPSRVNDLGSILLRFRLNEYACVADIEKAFLMLGLNETDRDSCRFFWPRDVFDPKSEILTYRFRVVLFGSTASQFLLNSTLLHHLSLYSDSTSDLLSRNIYIDNIVGTFKTKQELSDFYHNSKRIMDDGSFNLREWSSNEKSFKFILETEDNCAKQIVKVLGLNWHTEKDTINTKIHIPAIKESYTKRELVSEISKSFDPYGMYLPITITGKLLIQDVWKAKIGWDQNIPIEILNKWLKYIGDLKNLETEIQRRIFDFKSPTLHIFADASERCFGAVAYLEENGHVEFIMAKSRLSSLNSPTLPQLELTALNVAARLANFIRETFAKEFIIADTYLWSDSLICVSWVTNKIVSKKSYVRQRVENIKQICPNAIIRHVPGKENPADFLTRGLGGAGFDKVKNVWFNGSSVIHEREILTNPCLSTFVDNNSQICTNSEIEENPNSDAQKLPIIDVSKFDSYRKCLRVTAYVLRFIKNLKFKCSQNNVHQCYTDEHLSIKELRNAERKLVAIYQKAYYPETYKYLLGKSNHKPQLINQLKLYLDADIIRSGGRISNSNMTDASKFPILLPNKSDLTNHIILDAHKTMLHDGTNSTLSFVREKWWIPRGRQVIKSALRKCVSCLKVQGKPYSYPPEPPLPSDRVNSCKPFQICGIDYTGAIPVKFQNEVLKAYIVLFTCAVTRAIHLEIVYSLTEKDFLNAFIKFCSRRSFPQVVYSDNATYFTSSSNTLKRIMTFPNIQNYFDKNSIQWKFITPRAAWHGGIWERLIGLTKSTLKKVVGKCLMQYAEFEALICQIEAKLNDRPLTYASNDLDDLQPITPSQLLLGFKFHEFPDSVDFDELSDPTFNSKELLNKAFVQRTKVLQHFWKRWHSEYLLSLRERSCKNGNSSNFVKVGEVVQIFEDVPRVNWRLGLITEIIPSSDGMARSVKIKTKNGIFVRAVSHLYPLEIHCVEPPCYIQPSGNVIIRERRAAAVRAMDNMRM